MDQDRGRARLRARLRARIESLSLYFRGLFQYGVLQRGQTSGGFGVVGHHCQLQRLQVCFSIGIFLSSY